MRPYRWKAVYTSGEVVTSDTLNRETGKPFNPDRLDRSRLRLFDLHVDGFPVIRLHLEVPRRLIYFRRIEKAPGGRETVFHFVGWQENVKGRRNRQSIICLDERGGMHLIDGFRENHPLFHPPSEERMSLWSS